jgi:hypothetical protein
MVDLPPAWREDENPHRHQRGAGKPERAILAVRTAPISGLGRFG